MAGASGFEPPVSRVTAERMNRSCYTPTKIKKPTEYQSIGFPGVPCMSNKHAQTIPGEPSDF